MLLVFSMSIGNKPTQRTDTLTVQGLTDKSVNMKEYLI